MENKLTYEEAYHAYKNLVLKIAYKHTGNLDTAEEIMQETFLKLYVHETSEPDTNIKGWLCAVAENMAKNYKKKMYREIFDESVGEQARTVRKEFEAGPEEYFLDIESEEEIYQLHVTIMEALMEKNPKWFDALMLVYYLKVPQAEAAKEMGMTVRAMHSMLHRAKDWVKKQYMAEYEEFFGR